jgi:hypothetical protein
MRRWLLLVMILLLPMRAWVGDAMAGQMLQQRADAIAAGTAEANPAHHAAVRAHHDCDQHAGGMATAADAIAATPAVAADDCPTCASCQVCSSVALSPFVAFMPAAGFSQAPPSSDAPWLSSAEQALAFKPPRG